MKLSILDLAHIPQGSDARAALLGTLDYARLADRLGYERYWLAEHHNMPGIASAATSVLIGQVAAATQRIRVGAGGIMLPNHSPLVIAEQFGTLETLFPRRIDLGLGRAPGTDGLTWRALRRDPSAAERFPDDVLELQALLGPVQPGQRVRAVPGFDTHVPLWILGSSLFGAQLAAHLGLPYAFASHFAPAALDDALLIYRERFRPSAQLDRPYAMPGVNVIVADTDAEAHRLFTSLQQVIVGLVTGNRGLMGPPVESLPELPQPIRQQVEAFLGCSFFGAPRTVRQALEGFVSRTQADELIVATAVFDPAARRHSCELLAAVWPEALRPDRLECREPARAQLRGDAWAGQRAALFRAKLDRGSHRLRASQIFPLRIRRPLQALASLRIGLAGEQQIREALRTAKGIATFEQRQHGLGPQLERPVHLAVHLGGQTRELAIGGWHTQPVGERVDQAHARAFVAVMRRQHVGGRLALAQIVRQHRETHHRRGLQLGRPLQAQEDVDAGVDLRMPALGLRYPEEPVDLGKDHRERAALAQHAEEDIGIRFAQRPFGFLPDAFRDQRRGFASRDHAAHEIHRVRMDPESCRGEAGRESGGAQDAHRIFAERIRHVPQPACVQILVAAIRVDDRSRLVPRHRVDRQVAALQVFFERDVRREFGDETAIAGPGLAFTPRERVFGARPRVQEHGEIATDRPVALRFELGRGRADDHVVELRGRPAQQGVPNGAADQIDLHAAMLTDASRPARLAGRAVLWLFAALVAGCASVGYVAQAARGQFGVLRARKPIARLLADADTPPALRARLEQVNAIRDYASRELHLPDNASYRSYADLGRPYVVWNVVAAPALSLAPREWCFPVAGCVAYRGYFSEAAARAFAAGLVARGDDVAVFGVAAYSTLGKFSDPVLNTMTAYGPLDLAGLIFHELAHQKLYVVGDSAFNEAFATTVEEQGVARWAATHASPAALAAWHARRERGVELTRIIDASRARLREIYRDTASVEARHERRTAEFGALANAVRDFEGRTGFRSALHEWLDGGLNNAHLAAMATYRERQPVFETLFERAGGDFDVFYRAAEQIAEQRRAELRGPPRRRVGPHPPEG